METGTFKWWARDKPYGFITPDNGSADVFVHEYSVKAPIKLKPGNKVSFVVETTERGRAARDVNVLDVCTPPQNVTQASGRVTFWSERGYGFIESDDGTRSAYVQASELRVGSFLSEGDIVQFYPVDTAKGTNAKYVEIIGWKKPIDQLAAFADLGGPTWVHSLQNLAEDEIWEYTSTESTESFPILRSYIRHTFRRVQEMAEAIRISADSEFAAFNTGLVTDNQEEIFALFGKNRIQGRQPWKLLSFSKASSWEFVNRFGNNAPPLANYFTDPSVLLYDRRLELYISIDHVMENLDRFPNNLKSNPFIARQLLMSAEAMTKKRVYRNYKTAIPQYYRDKGKDGSVQLLLPLCLQSPGKADLALVVAKTESGNAYRGSTILTLDMAYNNARLLARPDTEWLQP